MRLFRFILLAVSAFSFAVGSMAAPVSLPSGVSYEVTQAGAGPELRAGQVVIVHYVGTLADGTVFDSSRERGQPFAFTLSRPPDAEGKGEIKRPPSRRYGETSQVIAGWDDAFRRLRVGDQATLVIPPGLAYGDKPRGKIPANSTLTFQIEVLDAKDRAASDLLREWIDREGIEPALRRFAALRAANFELRSPDSDKPQSVYLSESQLNTLGYRYLTERAATADAPALAVFRLNASLFPDSWNVHDSLGEALLKSGDRAAALAAYRRALELNPASQSARKAIMDLERPQP